MGTLIARDPGYVLVAYDGYSMQTSLWVMVGLFLGSLSLLPTYCFGQSMSLGMVAGSVSEWREVKRESRTSRLTHKGLRLLTEGEFDRARKFLDGAGEDSDSPRE